MARRNQNRRHSPKWHDLTMGSKVFIHITLNYIFPLSYISWDIFLWRNHVSILSESSLRACAVVPILPIITACVSSAWHVNGKSQIKNQCKPSMWRCQIGYMQLRNTSYHMFRYCALTFSTHPSLGNDHPSIIPLTRLSLLPIGVMYRLIYRIDIIQ